MDEDYYKTLGVRRDASQGEIQKAYRELARNLHPDLNPDDKAAKSKFQKVQKAFDVLNDSEKREMYDRYGSSFETMGAGGQGGESPWGGGFRGGPGEFRVEDVDLSQFFGGHAGPQQGGGFGDVFSHLRRSARADGGREAATSRRRGADISHEVRVAFAVAVNGGEVQITMRRVSGKTETINVKVPAGIEDGKKIRIRGQGEQGPRRGTPGDILITIRVEPHPLFSRRGNNLHLNVPVTLAEAALGAKIDVPTPRGTVSLTVPAGSSSGTKLRVKGHGVTPVKGTAGDLLAEIQIVLPKDLDDADRRLIEEFDGRYLLDPRAKLKW